MFRFITTRPFWVNLLVAIAIISACFALFFMSLASITKHDDIKKVPDVVGKSTAEAVQILESQGLKVSLQDSVYIDSIPKSSVLKESPDADALVKEGRTIFLTVNRAQAPTISMPDLRGFSITSAQLLLQNLGLKLEGTKYINDVAKNAVKQQLVNNAEIQPGTPIPVGTSVLLVLGNGAGNETMEVPDIVGMTLAEARDYLQTFNISIGTITANPDVTNQDEGFIIKQDPPRNNGFQKNRMKPGQAINVWLSAQDTNAPKPENNDANPGENGPGV